MNTKVSACELLSRSFQWVWMVEVTIVCDNGLCVLPTAKDGLSTAVVLQKPKALLESTWSQHETLALTM